MLKHYQQQLVEFMLRSKHKRMHRRIIVTDTITHALIDNIREAIGKSSLVISSSDSLDTDIKANQQALVARLGNEYDTVVYDALNEFDANIFYGAAGLVGRSGCYVVAVNSDVLQSLIGNQACSFSSLLLKHLSETPVFSLFTASMINECMDTVISVPEQVTSSRLSEQQLDIVHSIQDTTVTTDASISVLLGDRGRGKSTVLAELICSLAFENKNIIYTSAHRNHCKVIDEKLEMLPTDNRETVMYRPPDYFIDASIDVDTIIVIDEIASLAPKLFDLLQAKVSHIICAGTTLGYEGSARGFALRRLRHLKNPNIYTLQHPFRWYKDDPLELCLQRLFSIEKTKPPSKKAINENDIVFKVVDKFDLLNCVESFQHVFSVLFDAHYQTTPSNIQRIIDDDSHIITHVSVNNEIIGLAVLVIEDKSADEAFNQQVALGKRRKKGNLFQQNIALHLLEPSIMQHSFVRVHRIAVPEAFRGEGIGSLLLNKIKRHFAQSDYVLCTTFGITEDLHHFWTRNNYSLIKIGHKIDAASGTLSGFYIHDDQFTKLESEYNLLEHFGAQKRYVERLAPEIFSYYPASTADMPVSVTTLHHKLALFLDNQVPFERVKEAVFVFCLMGNIPAVIAMIEELAKKGLPKERRLTLEEDIRKQLKRTYSH